MAPVVKLVPPPPKPKPVAAEVADLDAFAQELLTGLARTTQPYRLNAARLNLADRYEQLRRIVPKRDAGKLTATFNRYYSQMFERKLALDKVLLSKPPKPEAGLPPVTPEPEPVRQKSHAELIQEALETLY